MAKRSNEMSPAEINAALGQVQGLGLKLPEGTVKMEGGEAGRIDPKTLHMEEVNRDVAAITGLMLEGEADEKEKPKSADDEKVTEDEEDEQPGVWADDDEPMKESDSGNLFTLHTIGYKGARPQAQFTFNATDMDDAISKAKNWCRYHSFKYGQDAVVKPAAGAELHWPPENGYVNR